MARSPEWNSHCKYMQMLCNIFFPILSLQLIKGSSIKQFFALKKENVIFTIISFCIWTWQSMERDRLNKLSTVGSTWTLVEIY